MNTAHAPRASLQVCERVEVQPRDAREASDVFYKQGMGDALLTYENEAVFTNIMTPNAANRMPYALPKNNIRARIGLLHATWP